MRWRVPAAVLVGGLSVFGYAPFGLFPLPLLTLAWLFGQWRRTGDAAAAATLGFAWGLGNFLVGVSWVYVSMHEVGGMAAPLAGSLTLAFCGYLALFPALAGFLARRWRANGAMANAMLAAGLWTLTEWLRGWLFTGFPWLVLGHSQAPPSPLAGFAPLIGTFGVSLVAAMVAGWISLWLELPRRPGPLLMALAVAVIGLGLRAIAWTEPVGEPLKVSLLQGNIPQSLKWVPERLPLSMDTYARLADEHPAPLTVLPETSIPLMFDQIPRDYLRSLTRNGDVLLGTAVRARDGGYTNGAVAVTPGLAVSAYAKAHLVPFGEFVPPGFGWFFGLVKIPMSDFAAGPPAQRPLEIGGHKILTSICYEDLFAGELLAAAREADLMVNLTNTAWFGDSLAQPQHLQIARLLALQLGRPMLRATNTGITAAVGPDGAVLASLPSFATDALTVEITGRRGITPFMQVGNGLAVVLAALLVWRSRRRAGATA